MLLLALQFGLGAHPLLANPYGGTVVAGGVQIESAGSVLNIHQSTDRAIIHWQGFSVGGQETTNFLQPSSSAAVLNRVTSAEASQILGTLNANGQVYLINPNGILVGNGAVVNVGSFVAATANVADEAFLQGGALHFIGATDAAIENRGTIHAHSGDVVLLAKTVKNEGTIRAGEGTAAMLAGRDFYLKKEQAGAVKVKVEAEATGESVAVGVDQRGTIEAVQARLEAAGNVYALAINQAGIIRATGVNHLPDGTVVLAAPGGKILQSGMIAALNRDGSGGRLSISGRDISAEVSSILTAAGAGTSGAGGQIEIAAENDAFLNGRLDVSAGDGAKGGRLVVTGERVGLFGGKVDASGGTGGGVVLLGGDYQGKNPLVRNASRTYVAPEAVIEADATVAGDGGTIIHWSDLGTQFYGTASARGGRQSGNGGLIEVSGRDYLDFQGTAITLAPQGEAGLLLLDPTNLTINTAGPNQNINTSTPFVPSGTPSVLTWGTITTALASGNVTVTTAGSPDSGVETGNITVGAAVAYNSIYNLTITAAAGGNITVNGGSTITNGGTGGLSLNTSGIGTITVGAAISMNGGGALSLSSATGAIAVNAALTGGQVTVQSSGAGITIAAAGAITATSGAVQIGQAGGTGITTAGNVTTSGGNVTYTGAVTLNGGVTIGTSGGSVLFSSTVNGTQALTINAGAGNVSFFGAVGGNTSLGVMSVNSTGTSLFNSTVNATSLTTDTGGSTTLNGNITLSGAATFNDAVQLNSEIQINTSGSNGAVTFASTVNSETNENNGLTVAAGSGAVSFNGAVGGSATTTLGAITINTTVTTSFASTVGAQSLTTNAGGTTTLNGNLTLTAATGAVFNDDVRINSPTASSSIVTINTEAGNGAVTFGSALDSEAGKSNGLTVTAGTATVTFTGIVGGSRPLGAVTINSAGTVQSSLAFTAASFTQLAGSVATTFAGVLNVTGAFDFTGTALTLSGVGANSVGTTMDITNSGLFTTASGANLTVGTEFVQDGAGANQLGGNITSTSDGITFAKGITLSGNVTLTSAGGVGDDILLSGTVNGAQALTLNAGSAGIATLAGTVGGSTRLGAVTISNAGTVNVDANVTAASFTVTTATTFDSSGFTINTTGANDAIGGAVSIGVTGQLTTGAITTTGGTDTTGGGGRNAGAITLQGRNIQTVGNLTATGSSAAGNNTSGGAGGAVTINDLTASLPATLTLTGAINSSGGAGIGSGNGGAGGAVTISTTQANSTINLSGTVTSTGGAANTGAGGAGGAVGVTTSGSGSSLNLTGTVASGGGASSAFTGGGGGAVTLTVGAASTLTHNGTINSTGGSSGGSANGAAGGAVTLQVSAGNTSTISLAGSTPGTITTTGGAATGSGTGGLGGNIALDTQEGSITLSGSTLTAAGGSSSATLGTGGAISIQDASVVGSGTTATLSTGSQGGSITFSEAVTGRGNLTLTTGKSTGTVTFTKGVQLENLTISAGQSISFNGGTDSIDANGAVLLQGAEDATTVGVGTGSTGTLNLSDTLLAALKTGASSVTIGRTGQTGTVDLKASGFTLQNPTLFRAPDGTVQISASLQSNNKNVTLTGSTISLAVDATLNTGSGTLTFNGPVSGAGKVLTVQSTSATGAVIFANGVTLANLVTPAGAYPVSLLGGGTFTSSLTFGNTGTVSTAGTITTTGGNINFSGTSLNVVGDTTLTVGSGASVILGAVSGDASIAANAGTLSLNGNVQIGGNLTATADTISLASSSLQIRSTGAGTVTLRPLTAGRAVFLGSATGTGLILESALTQVFTAGRVVVGQAGTGGSGAITLAGALDLSGQGYGGFSLLSNGANVTFVSGSSLTLPNNTDVVFNLGSAGNVNGTATTYAGTPTLTAAGGAVRFTANGVTLYANVGQLQTSTYSGGLYMITTGAVNVNGSQTAGGAFGLGLKSGSLTVSAPIVANPTAGNFNAVVLATLQNFYNLYGTTAVDAGSGRAVIYSQSPSFNHPPTGNGGMPGFSSAYLQPVPALAAGAAVGTFTLGNAPVGTADTMAFYGPQPVSEMDPGTLGQTVSVVVYKTAVPGINYSLPALYTGQVRMGFKAGSAPSAVPAPAGNPTTGKESPERLKVSLRPVTAPSGQVPSDAPALGRLRVGQVTRDLDGIKEMRSDPLLPSVRVGEISLRNQEDTGWGMAEVLVSGIKISAK